MGTETSTAKKRPLVILLKMQTRKNCLSKTHDKVINREREMVAIRNQSTHFHRRKSEDICG